MISIFGWPLVVRNGLRCVSAAFEPSPFHPVLPSSLKDGASNGGSAD
nr:hypothetical protein [Candidatus Freyarchaeota archaeon]